MLRRSVMFMGGQRLSGNASLADADPEVAGLLKQELRRQVEGLELIASENFTSRAVLDCLGSIATNKYAEGLPGARYYGGTENVDKIERLCQSRALAAYRLNGDEWGVNVQPYSGSPANFAAFTAMMNPHDRLMGLYLPHGGHLTHGFYTAQRRVSATSIYFESFPYFLRDDGVINYDQLEENANVYKPKVIVAGGSAYPMELDYQRFRAICDQVGAKLMVDMSHISGLIAAEEAATPFDYADCVTSTTHKTLRGPRAGMIFFRKESPMKSVIAEKFNNAVFPSLQGGPHMNQIAGVATALQHTQTPEFKAYIQQVKRNAKALSEGLKGRGYTLVSGGTVNHLMLVDFRPQSINGQKVEKILDLAHITVNKNSVPGDKSAVSPGGVRLGTPALTTRGLTEAHFETVAGFIDRAVQEAVAIQGETGPKLADFMATARTNAKIKALQQEVVDFSKQFPFPGLEDPFPV